MNTDESSRLSTIVRVVEIGASMPGLVKVPLCANPSCFWKVTPPSSCQRFDMRLLKLNDMPS